MALIYNHHVKELWFEQFLVVLFSSLPNELLVEREIDFVCCNSRTQVLLIVDLVDGLVQRFEILLDGLIDQYVAVGKSTFFTSPDLSRR